MAASTTSGAYNVGQCVDKTAEPYHIVSEAYVNVDFESPKYPCTHTNTHNQLSNNRVGKDQAGLTPHISVF